jgi:WD40 repeat protein
VDLENLSWSPDGRFIAVWESSMEYKIVIYYPDGRLVSSYSAYDFGLGIKSVTWSPSSQFLVVGSYDQKVRFLNYYTWKPLIEFLHPVNLTAADVKIYKEVSTLDFKELAAVSTWTHLNSSSEKIRYFMSTGPIRIPSIKPDKDKPHPKVGVSLVKFNSDGRYLATRNGNFVYIKVR